MNIPKKILFCSLLLTTLSTGCATSFKGDAKVNGGPRGCQNICSRWGMRMTGMVALGEYTDGCICSVPGTQASQTEILKSVATTGAGAAGVMMQMQDDDARRAKR
jgi:hypothetical protein